MSGSCQDITERKQAQEALAQSERQLRTVLDALPVGVWFTDRSGKPLLANPAAKQIWSNIKQIGLQTENHQAGWWETIGAANEPHRWALSQVLTTGVPSLNEIFDFECLDETKKTIRNSTVPVKNEAGVTLGAIVLNEDITLLRQAQAALQLTQFSVDHAVEGFLWIGPDARIFHVNDSTCRMLEYTWEELTTMTLHDIDPNLSSEVWAAHWEELKKKGSLTFESTYWSRTGRVLDMEVTVNYLQYEGKEYNCVIMRDIGERKRVEEALRASEERYRSLYDETPTMYFKLAMDGRVLSVNRFGAEQLGYQVEELIGHSVLGLFHEQDRETVVASLSDCLATPETTKHWEFRKIRKDGSILWVREVARVAQSSTEETVMLVTCEDVTERKINEQLLATEKRILEKIASDAPLQEVLTRICQMVEELLDGVHCSILLLDRDGLYLRHGAAPSLPEAYVHAIDGMAIGQAVGSCGTAAFMRRRVIVSDIARDPLWDDLRDLAIHHGLRACWSTPVIASSGIVLGTFAVYYGEPQQPTPVDLQIIDRATQIACIAIERKRTDESLRQNRVLLQSFVEHTPAAVAMLDRNLKYVAVSKRWYQDYRLGDRDIIGLYHYDVFPEIRKMEHWQAIHRRCLAGEVMRNDEDRLCREDGKEDWLRWEVRPWVDESGSVGGIIMFTEVITERKRAESKLRLTQFTIDHAVDAVYWINRQAQILDVNEAASLMLDYSKEELCAMTVHDLNPDFQADMWPEFWAESKRRGTMVAETVHLAKNGRLIPVEVSVNYLPYEGMEYHCAFVRDITERKRVDAALRQSEERYRSLVDNAPIGIFVNEEGRFTYVNREMQRILNATSVEQLIGTTVLDRIAPEFHQIVKDRIHELMENGQQAPTLDEQYVRLDGSRVDVAVAAIPTSFDGTPKMQVLVLDITERKRAEEALRKKNLELDHYFTSALDLLCGHFRRLNKAWQSTLGYSLEELKGAKFLDYVHPDDLEATRHALGDLTEQKEVLNFVNRYRRKDGSYRWIEWKSIPAGEFIYAAARDITDRKRIEETLRQRERDLQAALQERERISQDLHDGILQSLFAVGLALETAKLTMAPRNLKTSRASLNQAIDQLNGVMHEIRNFIAGLGSDLLQGKNFPAVLKQMLASLTEHQATRVRLAVEDRAAKALSTEQSLHLIRVIQEAVSNCIKHGHAREARVSLKMLKRGVRLSVRDNGRGFNQDDVKGIGYGLGNMAARAQKIGGRLAVLSKVNEGTSIVLDLPNEAANVSC
jgi:PAS domain S-box-containing protein